MKRNITYNERKEQYKMTQQHAIRCITKQENNV